MRLKLMVIALAAAGLFLASFGITQTASAQDAMCQGERVTVNLALGQLPTTGPDVILGTPADDAIAGMDGDDIICGGGGNDRIWGQGGDDSIDGGEGDDRLRGGADDDTLAGGPGNDDLAGGPGDDLVLGQEGDDTSLRGGGGDDRIFGGPGNDALLAGNGGRDEVNGGQGADKVTGGPRPDLLLGGGGDDELRGHKGADELRGGTGNDQLFGGPQPDTLDGGTGSDACNGGTTGEDAQEIDVSTNCETTPFVETVSAGRIASLASVATCEEYLAHMKSVASQRVGPYGVTGVRGDPVFGLEVPIALPGIPEPLPTPAPAPAPAPEAAPVPAADAAAEAIEFSDTNNQVVGVDEPDIIKTDGRRIVAINDRDLRIFSINGTDATPSGSLTLEDYPREMLLDGDRVLVIADRFSFFDGGPVPLPPGLPEPVPVPEPLPASPAPDAEPRPPAPRPPATLGDVSIGVRSSPVPYGEPITVITQIDISGTPTVLRTLELDGNYVSARSIDGVVRLVVGSPAGPLEFVPPYNAGGEQEAIAANLQIVEDSTLDQWLGEYTLRSASGAELSTGPLVPCDRIYTPDAFSGFGLLAVLTVDMQADLTPGNGTGVVTEAEDIYASQDSLYVATTLWPSFDEVTDDQAFVEFEENYTTALHRFDITNPTVASYVASGSAEGRLLNQFSMHEHDDRLFVATTQGSPWGPNADSESFVTSLEVSGTTLTEVGKVGNMGRGERIFAVRFVEDTAYVVTFRQVDPFYVVDLSNPAALVVTGELKIPGFSAYLHPISDSLILGVGQDATDQGQLLGAKVSLFDVSDPANPIERSVWTNPDSSSAAEWDHRAFLYWEPENLAVLPITQYGADPWSGAIALRVTEAGITEVARIDHAADSNDPDPFSTCRPVDVAGFFGPDAIAEVCGPDDVTVRPGFFCEAIFDVSDFDIDVQLADGEYLQLCFPNFSSFPPRIERTLVIGDSLWSMSYQYLQSNDLQTFDRTDRTPF